MESNSSSSNVTDSASWRSPDPYLFVGLTTLVLSVSVIFLILAFFYWKLCDDSQDLISDDEASGEGRGQSQEIQLEDTESKVMVIMAGDEKPTYLGKPAPAPVPVPCADTTLDTDVEGV